MDTHLTRHDTSGLTEVLELGGDLLLLPKMHLPDIAESLTEVDDAMAERERVDAARNRLWRQGEDLLFAYSQARRDGAEREFLAPLPLNVQRYLSAAYAQLFEDPLAIVNELPHTGVNYMVREDGLLDETARTFRLLRLHRVKQLGFLQAPWLEHVDHMTVMPLGENTRYLHSLDVAALATLIGYNLDLSESDRNTLRVAALTHDHGTPAGGDSVKLVDLEALDEDANYERLLGLIEQEQWEALKSEYAIDERLLVRTILGEGLLGEALNVADKAAYVARDINTCLAGLSPDDEVAHVGTRAIREILDQQPLICGIWDAVEVRDGKLVFTDVQRLINFLRVRIVLFREVYFHPRARFGEYLVSRVLVRRLYEAGRLTRDELLEMGDHELEHRIDEAFGHRNVTRLLANRSYVKSFHTRPEAEAFADQLRARGHRIVLVEDHLNKIKTGAHFLVDGPSGVEPLETAYPGDARVLRQMASTNPSAHVYYLDLGDEGDATAIWETPLT